jgi:Phospholipase_D-nuclease N-terminal
VTTAEVVTAIVIVVAAAAFAAYCLRDLARAPYVRSLSKPAWAFLIIISLPLGGVAYLTLGRPER